MNRHATAGNDDNSQSHHESLEEIAQLRNRERMLIGENGELRRQLVELKEEEKKKFDALLVEHRQLLSSNAGRSQQDENRASLVPIVPNDIHIKEEHFDDQSDNGQAPQMDKDDNPDTNAHNVNVNIKTEPMDCVFVVVKEEIKEEDDHDDYCDGCVRCLVKKEEVSDDEQVNDHSSSSSTNQVKEEIKEEYVEDISTNSNQVTVKTESNDEDVKVEIKDEYDHEDDCGCDGFLVKKELMSEDDEQENYEGGGRGQQFEEMNDEGGDHKEVIGANGDQLAQSSHVLQSSDEQANNDEVMNHENGLIDEDDLGGGDEMRNSANDNHDGSVVVSNEPSTSSTPRNLTKRKQTQTNRAVKKSKKTIEDDDGEDDEEDIATDDQVEDKIKVIKLNCTEENCEVNLNSLDQLHGHLHTIHGLLPHRCFAQNCNTRCDNRRQMAVHIKSHHSNPTQFVCHVCDKQFVSQKKTYHHWYHHHVTGQFECNLNGCTKVLDSRQKMHCHQLYKHCPESKRFECHHEGCASSFVFKKDLARHELTHLATRPFHCTWPRCSHSANVRSNLLKHIRTQHFGLPKSVKEQKEEKIEDNRDPNEYVRVVVEGDE